MGPYCQFCGARCFVERRVRDGSRLLLATCPNGKAHDRIVCGEDADTAVNPRDPIVILREFRASIDRSVAYVGTHRNPDALTAGAGRRQAHAQLEHDREWIRRPVIPQPRERAVACRCCGAETWNASAVCDRCNDAHPAMYVVPTVGGE